MVHAGLVARRAAVVALCLAASWTPLAGQPETTTARAPARDAARGVAAPADGGLVLDESAYCRSYVRFGLDALSPTGLTKDAHLLGGAWDNDKYVMDNNLYWNGRGQEVRFGKLSLEDWRKRGHDGHSIIADPKFVNVEKGDFSMAADSPAGKAGFKPIDASAVGPGPGQ